MHGVVLQAGICLATFSYSSFYEPSVVNAAEGGLQQLLNLIFAVAVSPPDSFVIK